MTLGQIGTIFHPSDFSDSSRVAFEHALKLAVLLKAELRIMHVTGDGGVDWTEFPQVRETLIRWKLLPAGSPRVSVGRLGIHVEKIVAHNPDPVGACTAELERNPADLLVLATHQHAGRMAWLGKSVAEPVARAARTMTLFIPYDSKGFVDSADGSFHLKSILIPVAKDPSPTGAINAVKTLTRFVRDVDGTVTMLHVGGGDAYLHDKPDERGWSWDQLTEEGSAAETILWNAAQMKSDLIVMTTKGRHGFLDLLRGTTTERVLRGAGCPVLAVPVGTA